MYRARFVISARDFFKLTLGDAQMRRSILFFSLLSVLPLLQAQDSKPLEIIITGGLVPVSRDNVGTSTTLITRQQIEQRGYQFVADILQDVPGLSIARNGSAGTLSEIRLRGAESDQTLVLIDGIEANDPAFSSRFDFAHLLAESVERIEVLRGAQSALWGSDAIGGVINIITRSGKGLDDNQYSASAEFGSFSTNNGAVSTRGDSGSLHYALSIQRFETDGFSAADENVVDYTTAEGEIISTGGNSEDDGYENTTAHFKFGFDPTTQFSLDGVVRYTDFESDFDSFTTIPVDGLEDRADGNQQYYLLKAVYSQMGGALNHGLKFFRNESDTDFFSSFGKTDSEGEKNHYGYQLNYEWGDGAAQQGVSFVLETEQDKLASTFSGNRKVDNDSVVAEYRFNNDAFAAAANARYDDNDLFDNKSTWRLAGSWKYSANARIHASYGTGIKNPTLVELFGFTPDFSGNENLSPEQSKGGDIGIEYIAQNARHFFDITYYHREIEDLITGSGNTAVNIDGESNSKGVELTYELKASDVTSLRAAYTYNDTEDGDGNQLVRRPKHHFSAALDYAMLNKTLNLGINLRHVKDRVDTAFNSDFTTTAVELDDYTVVDFGARYRVNESVFVKARIENVFDEKYQEVLGYGTAERAYYLGLTGDF